MAENSFDIIIIGSGLGGLVTANLLSKQGYHVCILEKNPHPGGCLQSFEKDGVVFDTGIHYVGALDEDQVLYKIFRYLDIMNDLNIRKMDIEGFDRFIIGDREYSYAMGYENFRKRMIGYFPDEEQGINKYLCIIQEIAQSISLYNLNPFQFSPQLFYDKFRFGSAWEFIQSVTTNEELRQLLSGLNSLYAGKKETSFMFIHALINNHYIESAWRFVDGSKQIADALCKRLRENGGRILLNKKAVSFQAEKGIIKSVKTSDTEIFKAKYFISTIHPYNTMEMLDEGLVRKAYKKRLQNIKNTSSTFSLYIALENGKIPYMNYNTSYYPNGDVWCLNYYNPKKFPQAFGVYPVADSQDELYTRALSVLAFMDYNEVARWENTHVEERGFEYEDFKQQKSMAILNRLEDVFPGIGSAIKSFSSATPLTLRDYTGTYRGATYGIERDFTNQNESLIFPRTKVPNLLLTGQNLTMHGMFGVSMGALLTFAELSDLNTLIENINNA
ncbi:MAG: NAD(P)/FAD-dependent oxidoreductase [Bacteroidales bacterium]|nr:NAD(P)/FAD-dependent oxidoreductase [Bacteroidales bacterium]